MARLGDCAAHSFAICKDADRRAPIANQTFDSLPIFPPRGVALYGAKRQRDRIARKSRFVHCGLERRRLDSKPALFASIRLPRCAPAYVEINPLFVVVCLILEKK